MMVIVSRELRYAREVIPVRDDAGGDKALSRDENESANILSLP
jgi:hypothetical protein